MKKAIYRDGIPVSPTFNYTSGSFGKSQSGGFSKRRLVQICLLSITVAVLISLIARVLVNLINLITNIAFYGYADFAFHSPTNNHLGFWVIFIPVIGGLLVGVMAHYGSKAIRGHGIPEAMEQILINESKINPAITFLKPLSSAIAIGTGGPFGAEGPIIATGGALGSTLGQLMKISSNERKVILAAGATAGMSAIFGTPIAAIFLAIELLLFEFSPRAILPVALACITGSAGHHLLFESGPVFPMPDVALPTNPALAVYSFIGVFVGFLAIGLTKAVYLVEDLFEKLPVHWIWWPAIGGLAVGIIGYFFPYTLGVGYDNITRVLSGTLTLKLIFSLFFFKFLSWAIALGSGTSGGTLAPLLTIGGACGAASGLIINGLFPGLGLSIPMAALIGMSSMFAGASRAYLTSITFALEATMQSHALLPLLGACTASYLISLLFMENTIMTEKIARRGIHTPDSYEPDILRKLTVGQVINNDSVILRSDYTIKDGRDYFELHPSEVQHFLVVDQKGLFEGVIALTTLFHAKLNENSTVLSIADNTQIFLKSNDSLGKAVELMSQHNQEFLPVLSPENKNKLLGVLTYKDILKAYHHRIKENDQTGVNISLRRQRVKVLVRSRNLKKRMKAGKDLSA